MNREDRQLVIIGDVLFLIGLIAFFGRVSIAEFLGASVVFGMPGDQAAITKIRIVGGVGAFLSVVGVLIVYGTVRRNLRQDDQQKQSTTPRPETPVPAHHPRRACLISLVVGAAIGLLVSEFGVTVCEYSEVPPASDVPTPTTEALLTVMVFGVTVHQEMIVTESWTGRLWGWGLTAAFAVVGAVVGVGVAEAAGFGSAEDVATLPGSKRKRSKKRQP